MKFKINLYYQINFIIIVAIIISIIAVVVILVFLIILFVGEGFGLFIVIWFLLVFAFVLLCIFFGIA